MKNDFNYKWRRLFASKRYSTKDGVIKLTPEEQQELLDDSEGIAMMSPVTLLEKVNRVEVIDEDSRSYVNWKLTNKTELSFQDDGKTLKVFISN